MDHVRSRVCRHAILLATALLASAVPAADAERAALEAAIQRWTEAMNAQDVATLSATMTADVEFTDESATTTGRSATIEALRADRARGRLAVASREITIVNDIAWHVASLTRTRKNGDVHAGGRALEIWKLENGHWRLHRRVATGADSCLNPHRPSTNEPVID